MLRGLSLDARQAVQLGKDVNSSTEKGTTQVADDLSAEAVVQQ
jgi:hypothetical protein